MNPLYLSRIKIQDFRTFGQFDIELPAQPGLMLVTGTNGLGKSSFFDAIEWGLTGDIRRFDSYLAESRKKRKKITEAEYLTRRGATADAHRVELGFGDAGHLARSATQAPALGEIIGLLAQEGWGPIRDVATYLAFTHFLGQAAQQRFTSRKRDEQWEALKGPSGIDRLERIRNGLRGRPTQLAFTKRIDGEKQAIEELERQIAQWSGWRDRLARLQEALSSSNTLDADAFAVALNALRSDVASQTRMELGNSDRDNPGKLLSAIEQAINAYQGQLSTWNATLDGLAMLPEEWATFAATADPDNPALESARVLLSAARAVHTQAEEAVAAAAARLQAHAGEIARLEAQILAYESQRRDLVRLAELDTNVGEAGQQLEQLDAQIAMAREAIARADERTAARSVAEAFCAQARSAAAGAGETLRLAQSIAEISAACERAAGDHSLAAQAADAARQQRTTFSDEQVRLGREQAAVEARIAALRAEADTIAGAVAAIAGHLHEDDTNCPVCRSHFAPGALRLLASAASTSSAVGLTEAELDLQKIRERLEQLVEEIARVDRALAHESVARVALEQSRATLSDLRARVAASLGTSVDADLVLMAERKAQRASSDLASAEAARTAASEAAAGIDAARLTLTAEVDALGQRRDSEQARLGRLDAERTACRERLAAAATQLDLFAIDEQLAMLRTQLTARIEQRATRERAASDATSAREEAFSQLRSAERALAEAQAAQQAALSARTALEARWTAASLPLPPGRAALERARSSLTDAKVALDALDLRRETLAQAGAAALLREELARLEAAMRAVSDQVGFDDPPAHAAALAEQLEVARAKLKLSNSARLALNKYTKKLQSEADGFSARVLAPLNDVIDAFNDAMLSTPDETINFSAGTRVDTTNFDMMLHYKDRVEDATRNTDLPPQIVLSEGQLAANGFSILCAASTAYPWSRWRALLLDDPLQHNDIIHTAAFVDVMRNLVEFEGYQLIMSSHDRAESEFITRKFEAAGLPCTKVILTAPAADGVQYEGPIFNRAAQRSLQGQTSQAS